MAHYDELRYAQAEQERRVVKWKEKVYDPIEDIKNEMAEIKADIKKLWESLNEDK